MIKNIPLKSILILFSTLSAFGLISPFGKRGFYISITLCVFVVLIQLFNINKLSFKTHNCKKILFTSILVWLLLVVRYICALYLAIVQHVILFNICCIIFIPISFLSVYFLSNTIRMLLKIKIVTNSKKTNINYLFLFITSIIVVTFCSECSFIYPINDWVDANTFFTMGKSVAKGMVMYKDVVDHKGPYAFFIYALGTIINKNSFIGIYFLQIINCFLLQIIFIKVCNLFDSNNSSTLLTPILTSACYCTKSYLMGGSIEEFCLPILAFSLYIGLKSCLNINYLTSKKLFLIGLLSGIILWTKFTLLGFYLGWIYVLFISFKSNGFIKVIKQIGFIVTGVLLSSIPVFMYFLINHAIKDLFVVYFIKNIFTYTETTENVIFKLTKNILAGFDAMFSFIYPVAILIFLGIFGLIKNKQVISYFMSLFVGLFTLTFVPKSLYPYYAFSFIVFIPFGIIVISSLIKNKIHNNYFTLSLCILMCTFISYSCSFNKKFMFEKREDTVQYKFAEIINSTENPTLLEYNVQSKGFLTATGIYPSTKYFTTINMKSDEILNEQRKLIDFGLIDFVVTEDSTFDDYDFKLYEKIATEYGHTDGEFHYYDLYVLKSLNNSN